MLTAALVLIGVLLAYIMINHSAPTVIVASQVSAPILTDPYAPPLKTDYVPVNVETRGVPRDYSQMGLLTHGDKILPLMGRRMWSNKWQYYAISNTGVVNTRLPITVNGRSCSGEYGCDEFMNGDAVFVEGYKQTFKVTLYESAKLQYIPYV